MCVGYALQLPSEKAVLGENTAVTEGHVRIEIVFKIEGQSKCNKTTPKLQIYVFPRLISMVFHLWSQRETGPTTSRSETQFNRH